MPKKKVVPTTLEDNLDSLLEQYEEDSGKEEKLIVRGGDDSVASIKGFVSTGVDLMDLLMTYQGVNYETVGRGWAIGRWYEVFGPPSSSKSTITHHAAAQVQKLNGFVVQLDSENATDDMRAMRMGFDTKKCLRMPTDYMEQPIEHIQRLFHAFDKRPELLLHPTLIILDSIAVMQTKKEFEKGMNAGGMMEKNRVLKTMIRNLCSQVPRYNTFILMVNQTMLSFKQFRGRTFTGTTTPGGEGPRFQHSVRLQFKDGAKYSEYFDEEMPAGKFIDVSIAKTKLFRPEGEVSLACNYMTGYDNALTNVHFLQNNVGAIEYNRKRYRITDFGENKWIEYKDLMWLANEDPDFQKWMQDRVFENMKYLYITGAVDKAKNEKEAKKEEEDEGDE